MVMAHIYIYELQLESGRSVMTSGLGKRAGGVLTTGLILPASAWSQLAL